MTTEEAMARWPRLTGHLICESLGYFTPKAAANAIAFHKAGEPYACEWYSSIADRRGGMFDRQSLLDIGREVLASAYRSRHHHSGYMAEYQRARELVSRSLAHLGEPVLASWF